MVTEHGGLIVGAAPNSITLGPDGNVWFTEPTPGEFDDGEIGVMTPTGTLKQYSTGIFEESTVGITAGFDGNLWFGASNDVAITSINPTAGHQSSYTYTVTSAGDPSGITADANGNLWFAQPSANQVGELKPSSDDTTEYKIPSSYDDPLGIALGPDGNLWFTEEGEFGSGTGIGWINPSNGTIGEQAIPTNSNPFGIVYDSADGNLWFTEEESDEIGRINPTTKAVSHYNVPTTSAEPEAITVDPSGNIWFIEVGAARIGELSPNNPSSITEYDVASSPKGIASDSSGDIWVTYSTVINEYNPTTGTLIHSYGLGSGNAAAAITLGPDGNLWFSNPDGKIGTITTAGVITENAVTRANPVGITSAPDGNIWFTGDGTEMPGCCSDYPNVVGVVTLAAANAPTQLAVTTQPPGSVTSAKGFGLAVSVENSAGNPDSDYTGSVTITLSTDPTGDTLRGTLTATVNDGIAVFSGLTLQDAGTGYAISATASGLSSVTTGAFDVTLGATQLDVTGEPPPSVLAGTPFNVTVSAEDGQGNVDTTYDGPITLSLGNANGATLSGVLVIGANDGVATFAGLTLNKPGQDYTILVSSGSLTSATSNGFDVTSGPATQLAVAVGGEPPGSVIAGGLFSLTLDAEDQYGDLATSFNGSVTLAINNNSNIFLQGNLTGNAEGGQITFSGLSIDTMGSYTIGATSMGLNPTTTSLVNVTPGQAVKLVVSPTNEPPGTIGAGGQFGFVVDAEDGFNNIDPTFDNGITIGLVDSPLVTLHGSHTATAASGVATFSGLSIDNAGTYTIQASSGSLAAGTTTSITVTPGPLSQLTFTTEPPGSILAAGTFGLSVGGADQYGNPVGTLNSTVAIALADSPGVTFIRHTFRGPAERNCDFSRASRSPWSAPIKSTRPAEA